MMRPYSYYFASRTSIVTLHAILTFLCATTRSIQRTFFNDGERSVFAFIFKIGHALNRSLLYRWWYISGGFYFEVEKRMEMVAQIKFFSLTATQILSVGPMFKNAIAVTENRESCALSGDVSTDPSYFSWACLAPRGNVSFRVLKINEIADGKKD